MITIIKAALINGLFFLGPGQARSGRGPGLLLVLAAALGLMAACASDPRNLLQDGYYTAEAADFDQEGWKEYLTIYICDGRIVSAEYDSRNSRGFLRSWDMTDKRRSILATGTTQSKYSRAYTVALLNRQDPAKVTPIPGAALVHPRFQRLAEAAMNHARAGSRRVAFVPLQDQ